MANFIYVQDLNGIHNPLIQRVASDALTRGDAVTPDATALDQVDLVDDAAEAILGVASHDTDAAGTANLYPASDGAIFTVPTVTTGYVEATHKNSFCDINTFTTGAMAVLPGVTGNSQVQLLGLVEGETSGSAGNLVYVKFNLRSGQGA